MSSKYYDAANHIFYNETSDTVNIKAKSGQTLTLYGNVSGSLSGGSSSSNQQIIYNSSGTLVGNANMTYDGTDLSVTGGVKTGNIYGTSGGSTINVIDLVGASNEIKIDSSVGTVFNTGTVTLNSAFTCQNTYATCVSTGAQAISHFTLTLLSSSYWGTPTITGESGIGIITYNGSGRWTINKTGVYVVTAYVNFDYNVNNGDRTFFLSYNSSLNFLAVDSDGTTTDSNFPTTRSINVVYKFTAGDYIEFRVQQINSGAATINMNTSYPGKMSIARVG